MKMHKVRWIVAIFVILGFLLIGTQSPAIEPVPAMKATINPNLKGLIERVYTNVCIKNEKNSNLPSVILESVFLWFDGEWRAQYTPIKTYQNFQPAQSVCVRVSPGLYRVHYTWLKTTIPSGLIDYYTETQQLNSGQRIYFYLR